MTDFINGRFEEYADECERAIARGDFRYANYCLGVLYGIELGHAICTSECSEVIHSLRVKLSQAELKDAHGNTDD